MFFKILTRVCMLQAVSVYTQQENTEQSMHFTVLKFYIQRQTRYTEPLQIICILGTVYRCLQFILKPV